MDTPKFPLSVAASVTGWPLFTLRNYLANKSLEWHEGDAPAKAKGGKSLISLRSVLRLAVTYELWKLGVSPRLAFLGAMSFTDVGTNPDANNLGLVRLPGELFPKQFDTLLLWRDGEGAWIVPAPYGGSIPIDVFFDSPNSNSKGSRRVAVVRVSDVVQSVLSALEAQS